MRSFVSSVFRKLTGASAATAGAAPASEDTRSPRDEMEAAYPAEAAAVAARPAPSFSAASASVFVSRHPFSVDHLGLRQSLAPEQRCLREALRAFSAGAAWFQVEQQLAQFGAAGDALRPQWWEEIADYLLDGSPLRTVEYQSRMVHEEGGGITNAHDACVVTLREVEIKHTQLDTLYHFARRVAAPSDAGARHHSLRASMFRRMQRLHTLASLCRWICAELPPATKTLAHASYPPRRITGVRGCAGRAACVEALLALVQENILSAPSTAADEKMLQAQGIHELRIVFTRVSRLDRIAAALTRVAADLQADFDAARPNEMDDDQFAVKNVLQHQVVCQLLEMLVISCHQPEEAQWPLSLSHDDQLSLSSTVVASSSSSSLSSSAAAAVDQYWYFDQADLWSAVTRQLAASADTCFADFAACGADLRQGTFIALLALTQCAVFMPAQYAAAQHDSTLTQTDGCSSQRRALEALREAAAAHGLAPMHTTCDVWEALAELAQQLRLFDELVRLCDCLLGGRFESADWTPVYFERLREYARAHGSPFTTALFEHHVRAARRVALLRLPDALPELSAPLLAYLQTQTERVDQSASGAASQPDASALLWLHGVRSGRFDVVDGGLEQLAATSDILRAFRNLAAAAAR